MSGEGECDSFPPLALIGGGVRQTVLFFTCHVTDTRRCFYGEGKEFFSESEGNVDQGNQYGNLHKGSYHGGKGRSRINPEYCNGNGDGQLEIVGRRRKAKSRRLFVRGAGFH